MDPAVFVPFADHDEFDAVEWLNQVFNASVHRGQHDGIESAQKRNNNKALANDLIHRLQLMVEQTNHSLQDIAQQLLLSIPKVMGAADILNGEAAELAQQVSTVRNKLTDLEEDHGILFESLGLMDRAKRQLQDMYQALQEANNWSVLSAEVEEVFEGGEIDQIASKICSMQKSLELLAMSHSDGGIDLSDKFRTLEALKDRFEQMVHPALEDAFAQYSDTVDQYYGVFRDLKRDARFVRYYRESLRDRLLREWATQVKLDADGTILDKLNFLYDRLTMVWRTEMNFFVKIVYQEDQARSVAVLMETFADVLRSLNPGIEPLIRCQLDQQSAPLNKLKLLIELKHFTNGFVGDIEKFIVTQMAGGAMLAGLPELDHFCRQAYQPFRNLHSAYLDYETQRLNAEYEQMLEKYEHQDSWLSKLLSLIRDSFKMYDKYVQFCPLPIVLEVHQWLLIKCVNVLRERRNANLASAAADEEEGATASRPISSRLQKSLLLFHTVADYFYQFLQYRKHVHTVLKAYCQKEEEPTDPNKIDRFRRFDLFILDLTANETLRNLIYYAVEDENGLLVEVTDMSTDTLESAAQDICQVMSLSVKHYLSLYQPQPGLEDNHHQLSPSECITQVGQYLLMFPQHLEPFSGGHDSGTGDHPALATAVQHAYRVFARYLPDQAGQAANCGPFSELLLECLLHITVSEFLQVVLQLDDRRMVDRWMRKQIAVDLSYLVAVCGDLGMSTGTDTPLATFGPILSDTETPSEAWLQQLRFKQSGFC